MVGKDRTATFAQQASLEVLVTAQTSVGSKGRPGNAWLCSISTRRAAGGSGIGCTLVESTPLGRKSPVTAPDSLRSEGDTSAIHCLGITVFNAARDLPYLPQSGLLASDLEPASFESH